MKSPLSRPNQSKIRGAAVICAACAALVAGSATAQQGNGLVPDSVLSGAASQSVDGRRAISNYLLSGNPRPQDIAARAVVAINSLQRSGSFSDPAALIAAADRIAQVATPALCPPKVMKVFVDQSFSLPPTAKGFDFGPPDVRTMTGFERVAPGDQRLRGGQPRALQRPGNQALLSNGIVGVNKFSTPMANGTHRVLLFTDDIGDENTYLSPLGGSVIVNGREVALGDHPPDEWLPQAVLSAPGSTPNVTSTEVNGLSVTQQRGGALMVDVEITNGQLEVELIPPGGGQQERQTYLVGAVAEPVATANAGGLSRHLDASQAILNTEECLELEADITTALADLLEEIEPAAGPELELLDLPEPVIDDGERASDVPDNA